MSLMIVAGHTALLLAYTLPADWVPLRLRYWSQAYCRVLFHQDWRLFAPDPPECGCSIEVKPAPEAEWLRLSDVHDHPVWRRMSANACRFVEASRHDGDTVVIAPLPLTLSLERMAGEIPRQGPLQLRARRQCQEELFLPIRLHPHR